jgi:16S rRNA processing protein RimM
MTPGTDTTGDESGLLEIGTIVRPHGLLGEVVVDLVSNRLERIDAGSRLVAELSGGAGERTLVVESSRPFQHRHLVRFEQIASRETAEAVRGAVLKAEPIDDVDTDDLFVHRLIGCEVVEVDGTAHGLVAAIEANPASDLLVGEGGWLVPLRFVVEWQPGKIVVDAPVGLFE